MHNDHRIAINLVSSRRWGQISKKKFFFLHQIAIIFLPLNLRFLLGAQKNCLIEMVLLSTHNICFLLRNNKNNFYLYTLIWRSGNVVVPFWRSFLFDKSQNVKKIQTASSLSCEIGIILKTKNTYFFYIKSKSISGVTSIHVQQHMLNTCWAYWRWSQYWLNV